MLASETDKEAREIIELELSDVQAQKKQLEEEALGMLLEPEPYADCDRVTMTFLPGVGGSESALFAKDLKEMYECYFGHVGFNSRVLQELTDANGGFKSCSLRVSGDCAYENLICESGAHKVIRVPETETKGRLHSSAAIVIVLPEVPNNYVVNEKDIKYEFMRSGGAGGQHVNKTESACRATHIPTGLSVHIQDERQQDRNKIKATSILKEKVFRQHYEEVMAERNRNRKLQRGTGDRSDKIRTYNFAADRISDHRTGVTLHGMERMLAGEYVGQLIAAYQEMQQKERMEQFLR
ncbi:peptide chain release factor 1-like [Hippocampus zosterae]|uniref:peptide chain release factor 1-like n=1 Tax=Hippocampus zosterae TaxID=109293 RepID=UPI00223E624D|nr:peptide chain release factor 1-like [Hippocampus zosterae]